MKRIRSLFNKVTLGSMLEDLLYLVFGIFLVFKTADTSIFLVRLFGFLLLISGLFSVIRFVFKGIASKIFNVSIIGALVKFLVGILVLIKPNFIQNLLAISIGVTILCNGLIKLYYAFTFYNNKEEIWPLIGVISVGLIIMGGSLIINPFSELVLLTRVSGIFVIIFAIFDGMQWMLFRKRCSSILKLFK